MGAYDSKKSRAGRDDGIGRVRRESFMKRAMRAIKTLPRGHWTGEDIRRHLTGKGIRPHHPNAWGGLIFTAVLEGILEGTGTFAPMRAISSHYRKTAVYRVRPCP